MEVIHKIGRRKTAVARVYVAPGTPIPAIGYAETGPGKQGAVRRGRRLQTNQSQY